VIPSRRKHGGGCRGRGGCIYNCIVENEIIVGGEGKWEYGDIELMSAIG